MFRLYCNYCVTMVFSSIFITILILQKLRFSVKVYKNIKQLFYKAHLSSSVNIIYTIACFTKRWSVASSSPANDFPCLQPITTQSAVDNEPFYLWNDPDRCFLNSRLLLLSQLVWNVLLAHIYKTWWSCWG